VRPSVCGFLELGQEWTRTFATSSHRGDGREHGRRTTQNSILETAGVDKGLKIEKRVLKVSSWRGFWWIIFWFKKRESWLEVILWSESAGTSLTVASEGMPFRENRPIFKAIKQVQLIIITTKNLYYRI
jgi:hypothetical protein